ncbi:MAG: GldG family protein [Candidatus Omnitrophica bacterium]|nr:GldG family protein [Candidatus Omnitrophota bacterium]
MKRALLLGLSYILLATGLGYWYVSGVWSWLVLLVLILGAGSLLALGAATIKARQLSKSRTKGNWAAVSIVILLSCALAGINWSARVMNVRKDLTRAHQHSLTKFTSDFLVTVNEKIKITVLFVGLPPKYIEDRLKEYERAGRGFVSTEIVDPLVDLSYAAQFGNTIKGDEKKVIVSSKLQKKIFDLSGEEDLTEERLTNAMIQVSRPVKTVYFLGGHQEYNPDKLGEDGYSKFKDALKLNSFNVKPLLLGIDQASVPDDCDVLVIAGPKEFFSDKEEKSIQEYLNRGGDAFIMVEQVLVSTKDKPLTAEQLKKNPSLNSLLNPWGVKVGDDIVVDLTNHASGDVGSPATRRYMSHPGIIHDLDYTFYLRPRSILPITPARQGIKTSPLMLTMSADQSWGETDRYLKVKLDPEDQHGPVPIAFVIWEPKNENKKSDTRIVVFTDADFLSDPYIGYYSNMQMGLNVVNWLAEVPYQTFYDKQAVDKVPRADLTSEQKKKINLVLIAIPFFIIVFGVMSKMVRE